MANFPKMKLTNAGLELLANVQAGADTLTFTKTALGDGEVSTPISNLHNLVSPKVEIAITEGKQVGTSTYQIGAFFSNAEITTGFWWREIGVFAKGNDGNEVLYCYSNAGDAGDYIPVGSDERVEKYIYQSLAIGNAENVTAEINETDSFILKTDKGKAGGVAPLGSDGKVGSEYLPDMNYASKVEAEQIESDLSAHLKATNPHNISAATVGLDKVPNVATNDQTPTYTEASTLATLTSGENLSVAFGKIKKAITDFVLHIADTTKHITSAERTTWDGKANSSHSHSASEVGAAAANHTHTPGSIGAAQIQTGSYVGTGESKKLTFSFRPKLVIILRSESGAATYAQPIGCICVYGFPYSLVTSYTTNISGCTYKEVTWNDKEMTFNRSNSKDAQDHWSPTNSGDECIYVAIG